MWNSPIEQNGAIGYNYYMKAKQGRPGKPAKKPMKTSGAAACLGRVVNVSQGFRQAREWEILQEISLTPGQRQRAARALKERFYGRNAPDVRKAHGGR